MSRMLKTAIALAAVGVVALATTVVPRGATASSTGVETLRYDVAMDGTSFSFEGDVTRTAPLRFELRVLTN